MTLAWAPEEKRRHGRPREIWHRTTEKGQSWVLHCRARQQLLHVTKWHGQERFLAHYPQALWAKVKVKYHLSVYERAMDDRRLLRITNSRKMSVSYMSR